MPHMTANPTSVQGAKPLSGASVGSAAGSTDAGHESLSQDVSKLRLDLANLNDTLARVTSQMGGEAVKTVRNLGQTVASQVGSAASGVTEAGSELAANAKEHAKTFASELEGMARRNPLGTVAGALFVGVIIGMMSRGRG
jgi:ElaB/YqjD/DUF883 family membrane-anchored ribosome-binding protein